MTFLTFPFLIGGCLATLVPVFLHLLLRSKPKRIEFPALMLLKKRFNVNKRSYRLKHLVLLVLRVLMFVLLGLALARPSVKVADWFPSVTFPTGENQGFVSSLAASLGSQDAPISAAIVVDSSLRMDYVAGNRNRLDVAREFGRWILSHLPHNSQVAVLSSLREAEVFQIDMLAAEEKLNRLTITPLGRPVADAVSDAIALLNSSGLQQRELYVLTDLSEPGWPDEIVASLRNRIGEKSQDFGIFLVDVGVENPTDSALLRVTLSNQVVVAQRSIQITVEISHIGKEASKTVEIVLNDPKSKERGAETIRGSKTFDFSSGESRQQAVFTLAGEESGTHQGTVRFTTADALAINDRLFFTIEVRPPEKLLLIAPPNASTLYLRTALQTVPFDIDTLPLIDLKTFTSNALQVYRAAFLLDPTLQEPATWKKLADYAASGHGIGVFLGANAGVADSLPSFNDPAATEILGGKLLRQARRPDGDLWIAPEELHTTMFAPFRREGSKESFPWDALPIFRYWEMSELTPKTQIIAPFSDGRPAILAQTIGQGFALTVTTPVSESPNVSSPWNELTRGDASWMFLLYAEGIANYLLGEGERNFNFKAGEHVVIRPKLETLPPTCLMATPSGESIRLTPDVLRREISVASSTEPGNYRLRSGGAKESLDTGFSVNMSGDEMNLRRIGPLRLDQAFGEGNYRLAKTPTEIERNIARRRVGQELYAAVLLLLLAVFATEYVVSNRFFLSSPLQKGEGTIIAGGQE